MATPVGHSIVGYTLARAAGVSSPGGLALAVGAAPQQVLRVSFTNAERDQGLTGQGWWDVSPGQVTAADGPVDAARFTTC